MITKVRGFVDVGAVKKRKSEKFKFVVDVQNFLC